MKTGEGKVCLRVVGAMCFAGGVIAMWATDAYGQQAAAGSTQPAKADYYSLGRPPGLPFNPVRRVARGNDRSASYDGGKDQWNNYPLHSGHGSLLQLHVQCERCVVGGRFYSSA